MKIIVLGNGFDLATNLPTSYKDFFKYSHKKYEDDFKLFTDFIEENTPTKLKFFNNIPVRISNEKKETVKINSEIARVLNDKIQLVSSELSKDISVWDIFFLLNFENKENDINWHFVEEKIKKEIVQEKNDRRKGMFYFLRQCDPSETKKSDKLKDSETPAFFYNYFKDKVNKNNPLLGYMPVSSDQKKYKEDVLFNLNKKEFFIYTVIKNRYQDKMMNYHQILLEELMLFEKSFANYIRLVTEETILSGKGQTIYRDNLLKLSDEKEDEYYLINFNYTEFSSAKKKVKFTLQRSKQKINIVQQNVHGVYYKRVIFGIDQSLIPATSNAYMFTKTFRKMDYYDSFKNIAMPNKNDVSEIIFYGHSLAEADYSYFQSIFDYYGIYDSDVTIKFCYSFHGNKSGYWKIKQKRLQESVEVVEKYGKTLNNNKDQGKNLMHKLLLENRLKFKKIELEKVSIDNLNKYFDH